MLVLCARSRASAVLALHFPELDGKPAVTDEYSAYNIIDIRQTCPTRLLLRAEIVAIRGGEELHVL